MAKIYNNTCDEFAQSLIIASRTDWHNLISKLVAYNKKINALVFQLANDNHIIYHANYRNLIDQLMDAENRARAAEEARADFLDNMRHDFRTPLSNIVGLCGLLQTLNINDQQKLYIDKIALSGKQILQFFSDILEVDNIDSGRRPLHFAKINIRNIIDDVNAIISVAVSNKNLEFTVDIKKNIPKTIIGDQFRIRMILLNLLTNAVKFTSKGKISISLKAVTNRNELYFCIKDTGIGIPKNKFEFIFEKFTQFKPSHESREYGLGLGLYMVAKFIQELAGTIKVSSKSGQGTIFDFTIPYRLP